MRKSHKIQLIAWMLLLFPGISAFAQSTVTGIVRDNNGSLPGVTIYVMGNNERALTGATTNENGEYYLTVPTINHAKGELKIVFSFIGYKPQEVIYKNQKVINITLAEDIQTLETVNVVSQMIRTNDAGLPVKDMGVSNQRINMQEMEEIQGHLRGRCLAGTVGQCGHHRLVRRPRLQNEHPYPRHKLAQRLVRAFGGDRRDSVRNQLSGRL